MIHRYTKGFESWTSCNSCNRQSYYWVIDILCASTHLVLLSQKGIAPITVVTHRDKVTNKEECENALYEASAATVSSPSHTFFESNYTKNNSKRNPETERMTFEILHYAMLTAESAMKIMKQKQRNEEEDEMMRALEGTNVSGQVAPDSAEGNWFAYSSGLVVVVIWLFPFHESNLIFNSSSGW